MDYKASKFNPDFCNKLQNNQRQQNNQNVKQKSQLQKEDYSQSHNYASDQLFDDLFSTISANLADSNVNTSSTFVDKSQFLYGNSQTLSTTNENAICLTYKESLIKQVENQYEKKRQQTLLISNNNIQKYQRNLENLTNKKEQLEDKLSQLLTKAELECHNIRQRQTAKYFKLPLQIIQNWIFSIIVDSEKCARFAQMKQQKALDGIQTQKIFYNEDKIFKTVETLIGLKQLNFIKFTQTNRDKFVKSNVQNAIIANCQIQDHQQEVNSPMGSRILQQSSSQIQQFEQLAVIRKRPYTKNLSLDDVRYQISLESQRIPSLYMIMKNTTNIADSSTESSLKTENTRFQLNSSCLKDINSQQIITNQFLNLFNDPEVKIKDLRIFICAKELLLTKQSEYDQKPMKFSKMLNQASTLNQLINNQYAQLGGTKAQSHVFQLFNDNKQQSCIKKIKGSNQLKVELNSSKYSILCEAKLIHLMKSEIFAKYFDVKDLLQTSSLDDSADDPSLTSDRYTQKLNQELSVDQKNTKINQLHFYIIEQDSLFSVPPQYYSNNSQIISQSNCNLASSPQRQNQQEGIINGYSRGKCIRRLRDFEILMLLLRYFTVDNNILMVEAKWSSSILKKMQQKAGMIGQDQTASQNQNQIQSQLTSQQQTSQQNSTQINSKEKQLCQWPNCLQIIEEQSHSFENIRKSQSLKPSPQQNNSSTGPLSSKKRPESAHARKNIKKLTRLPIALELEINDSSYVRFMKRFKMLKDKSIKAMPVHNVSGFSQDSKQSTNWVNSQTNSQSQLSVCCGYHREIQQFLALKMNTTLAPAGLTCNNFYKGLKNFETWKEDQRTLLSYDMLVSDAVKQGNGLREMISKIFAYSVNQSSMQVPNMAELVMILQQQPPTVNILDNFYKWVSLFMKQLKTIDVKSPHFLDATNHFIRQLQQFIQNQQQAKMNEECIVNEIQKWLTNKGVPKQFLREIYAQLADIVNSKDIVLKFQLFQQILDRINNGRNQLQQIKQGTGGNLSQLHAHLQFSQQNSGGGGNSSPYVNNENGQLMNMGGQGGFPRIQEQSAMLNKLPPFHLNNITSVTGNVAPLTNNSSYMRHDTQPQSQKNSMNQADKLAQIYGAGTKKMQQQIQLSADNHQHQNQSYNSRPSTAIENSQQTNQRQNMGSGVTQNPNLKMARKFSAGSRRDMSALMIPLVTAHSTNNTASEETPSHYQQSVQQKSGSSTALKMSVNYAGMLENQYTIPSQGAAQTQQKFYNGQQPSLLYTPQIQTNQTSGSVNTHQSSIMAVDSDLARINQLSQQQNNLDCYQLQTNNYVQKSPINYSQMVTQNYQQNQQQMASFSNINQQQHNLVNQQQLQQQTKQRSNSAHKFRPDIQPNAQLQGTSVTYSYQANRVGDFGMAPADFYMQNNKQTQQQWQNQNQMQNLKKTADSSSFISSTFQQPPKIPINIYSNQQQLNSIYNATKSNNGGGSQKHTTSSMNNATQLSQGVGINSLRQQRNLDRQVNIAMTYTNAVPRVGSANPDKRKMGQTLYEKNKNSGGNLGSSKKSKKHQQSRVDASNDKQQLKLNNFVKMT